MSDYGEGPMMSNEMRLAQVQAMQGQEAAAKYAQALADAAAQDAADYAAQEATPEMQAQRAAEKYQADLSAKWNALSPVARQILSQNTSSNWTGQGFGSTQANAEAMADVLAQAGITDINQFGQRTNDQGATEYYNKSTGQTINPEYSKAGGNIWSGTFAGEGSTSYGVQFDAQGNPYFYTQYGGSSNDLAGLLDNPIINIAANVAAAATGGPLGVAALNAAKAVANGGDLGDAIAAAAKGAATAYVGAQIANGVGNLGDQFGAALEYGTDIGSQQTAMLAAQNAGMGTAGDIAGNLAGSTASQLVTGGGKIDPLTALVSSGVNAGTSEVLKNIDGFSDLNSAVQGSISKAVSNILQNGNLTPSQLINIATTTAQEAVNEAKVTDPYFATGAGTGELPSVSEYATVPVKLPDGSVGSFDPSTGTAYNADGTVHASTADTSGNPSVDVAGPTSLPDTSGGYFDAKGVWHADLTNMANPDDLTSETSPTGTAGTTSSDIKDLISGSGEPINIDPNAVIVPSSDNTVVPVDVTGNTDGLPTETPVTLPLVPEVNFGSETNPETPTTPPDLVKKLEDSGLTSTPAKTVDELLAAESPTVASQTEPTPKDYANDGSALAPPKDEQAPAKEVAPVEQPPSLDDFLKTIGITSPSPDTTPPSSNQDILDAIGYTEPATPTETPSATTPDVTPEGPVEVSKPGEVAPVVPTTDPAQELIDKAVADQQESAQEQQPTIDQQTQDLLNELSGGTDNGVTPTDYSNISDILAGGQTEIPPTDYSDISDILSGGQTDTTPADYSDISDILSGGQTDTTPADQENISDILTGGQTEIPTTDLTNGGSGGTNLVGGYIDETNGHWIDTTSGKEVDTGLGGPLNNDNSGNLEFMKDWTFDPGSNKWAWTDPATGETTNYEYETPIRDGPLQTGKDIEDSAGAGPADGTTGVGGGTGTPTGTKVTTGPNTTTPKMPTTPSGIKIPAPIRAPTTPTTPTTPATNVPTTSAGGTTALLALLASLAGTQQSGYMPSVGDVAHIKSNESLFGALPGSEPTPASSAQEKQSDPLAELQSQYEDQQYASGGHVDDFSVDALLHILRS